MEQAAYNEIMVRLEEMTPSLTQEVLLIFQSDPDLVERFGDGLVGLVDQEVIRLRDLLLGSILLDYPGALGRQLKWLVVVATARNFNLETVRKHLRHWRFRLQTDLPIQYVGPVLAVFDRAVEQM